MIFKYCVWPTVPKDEIDKNRRNNFVCGDSEYAKRFVGSVLRCCPCAFRWRQAIGIDEKEIETTSIVNQVHRLTNTPVITLRSNQNSDAMYVHELTIISVKMICKFCSHSFSLFLAQLSILFIYFSSQFDFANWNPIHHSFLLIIHVLFGTSFRSDFRDKNTIEEEEHNEINKRHFAVQANSYKIQNSNDQSSQCPGKFVFHIKLFFFLHRYLKKNW